MDSSPKQTNGGKKVPTIRDLFPELNKEKLKEAEQNFNEFLKVTWRIYERLRDDHPELLDTPPSLS